MKEWLEAFSQSEIFITIIAYLSANLGVIIFSAIKLIGQKTAMQRITSAYEKTLADLRAEMAAERDEIKKYAKAAIDDRLKAQDAILESKATNLIENTKTVQSEIKATVDDILEA